MWACLTKNTALSCDWREQSDWHAAIVVRAGGQVLYARSTRPLFFPSRCKRRKAGMAPPDWGGGGGEGGGGTPDHIIVTLVMELSGI